MTKFKLRDLDKGNENTFDDRQTAEEQKANLESMGVECELEIVDDGASSNGASSSETDASATQVVERVESPTQNEERDTSGSEEDKPHLLDGVSGPKAEKSAQQAIKEAQQSDIPEPSNLTSDPLQVIRTNAEQFTDTIKGKTVINRQGYAVLAERFNISVVAEPVTRPPETDFEYAEFRAIATTEDGQEYSGFGSASVDRGDDATLLAELAETRAMKRSCAWATGVGMTAVSELEGSL